MEQPSILASVFRKKMAETKDYSMTSEATEVTLYPTQFLNVDFLNGFKTQEMNPQTGVNDEYYAIGIPDGSYITFIANANTGKTTFVCQLAANIVRRFKTSTIFEDSIEAGLTPERRRALSRFTKEEYKTRYIIRDSGVTAENIYQRIKAIHDIKTGDKETYLYDTGHKDMYGDPIVKMEPTVYIIDSLAMLMPEKYVESDEMAGKSMGAASALVISNVFKSLFPMLKEANIILIGINHILEDVNMSMMPKKTSLPGLKQGERVPKGRTATYLAGTMFRMDYMGKLKPDETYHVEGSMVDISLIKSRTSGKKVSTRLIYDFSNGFDPWLSLLRYMQDRKLLFGGGASLYFEPEKKYRFSYGNFREQILSNKEFRDAFINVVVSYLKQDVEQRDRTVDDLHLDDLMNSEAVTSIL